MNEMDFSWAVFFLNIYEIKDFSSNKGPTSKIKAFSGNKAMDVTKKISMAPTPRCLEYTG